jgi:glutamyl-tRNA(Gln) amidotransferase subunit E
MRPTLSELGEYDGTALMEFKTKKEVVYQLFRDAVCTYEMDDTPPFSMNQEALDIAIEIALLLNCTIVDEVHVSRKQYLDGSIPTGFQRTTIVGVEGWVPYQNRKIRIAQLALEEDACREVSDVGHTITFRTDRLSTPLVEIVTYPDMRTPREAAEVNALLGRLLRSTRRVRRGIGSVRQDVNVSIEGGTRVEIKGVSKIGYVELLSRTEGYRQKALLELREELQQRGITAENIQVVKRDITHIVPDLSFPVLSSLAQHGSRVKAIRLDNFAGTLAHELQPNLTFAFEISGRIKVIACIDTDPNLLHSDDPDAYGGNRNSWNRIRKAIGATDKDAVAVVFGSETDTETALQEIEIRATEATAVIPNETRQAFRNGTTGFERILPGPDRMYPDTDLPPTPIESTRIDRIEASLPEAVWNEEERYMKVGLTRDQARMMSLSGYSAVFDRVIDGTSLPPRFVAHILLSVLEHLRRSGLPIENLTDEVIARVFDLIAEGRISKTAARNILPELARVEGKEEMDAIVERYSGSISKEEVAKTVSAVLRKITVNFDERPAAKLRYVMGKTMAELGGRADGQLVREAVSAHLEKS